VSLEESTKENSFFLSETTTARDIIAHFILGVPVPHKYILSHFFPFSINLLRNRLQHCHFYSPHCRTDKLANEINGKMERPARLKIPLGDLDYF